MRKIKAKKRNFYKKPEIPELNVMECHKIVEGVANKINKERLAKEVIRELGEKTISEEIQREIKDETTAGAIMVFSNILLNHWKKLTPRKTRIKVMYEMFQEIMRTAETTPDEKQLAAEAEFERQTGLKVIRD